jgi:two-component system, chemotaxis family, chemotaxis protein CheY
MHRIQDMNALLVEHSRAHRLVTHHALVDLGFNVTEVESGGDALGRLKREMKMDVVLVDSEMPDMDSVEFIRKVRAEVSYAETPIILVGSMNFVDRLREALEAGASEYIIKPFTKEILGMKLELLGIEAGKSA